MTRGRRLAALSGIVLAVGGVVAAAVVADDDGGVQVAAAGAPATTTSVELPPTTEVTVPTTVTLPVTVPEVTLPRLRPRPAPPPAPVPTTIPVPAPPPAPKPQGGARCGTPSGYAGLGADRTGTAGRLTVTLQVYSCEIYDGESMQTFVYVDDRGSIERSIRVDYGDGTVYVPPPLSWRCDQPERPNPWVMSTGPHEFRAAGAYDVTATVTTASCDGWETGPPSGEEQTATVRMTVYRVAGKRPG